MATTEKIIVQIHERTNFAQLTTDLQLRELGYESTNKSFNFNTNGGTNLTLWAKQSVNVAFDNAVRIGVSGSSGGAVASSSFNEVVIESSGASGITIMGPDSQLQGISFTSPSQTSGAFIDWSYNNNELLISTNNAGAKLVLKAGTSPHTMTLLSDGKVGIGTESPDGNFHSHAGSAGSVTASGDANSGVFEGSGVSMGISLLSPNSSNQNIYFGSVAGNVKAFQRWNHDTGVMTLATNKTGGQIQFKTNTADIAMTLLSDGKVGIGTESPASELTVYSNSTNVEIEADADFTNGTASFLMRNDAKLWLTRVNGGNSDSFEIRNSTDGINPFIIKTDGTILMNEGKVGIGTDSPSELLELGGQAVVKINLTSNNNVSGSSAVQFGDSDDKNRGRLQYEHTVATERLSLWSGDSERVSILADGKVGIGTTSPSAKLEVDGDVTVTNGDIRISEGKKIYFDDQSDNIITTQSNTFLIESYEDDIHINPTSGEVKIFRGNTLQLETTISGVSIKGEMESEAATITGLNTDEVIGTDSNNELISMGGTLGSGEFVRRNQAELNDPVVISQIRFGDDSGDMTIDANATIAQARLLSFHPVYTGPAINMHEDQEILLAATKIYQSSSEFIIEPDGRFLLDGSFVIKPSLGHEVFLNLPSSAGTQGSLYSNNGIVTVSP